MVEKRYKVKSIKFIDAYSDLGGDTFVYQISLNGSIENVNRIKGIEKGLDDCIRKEWRSARIRVFIIRTRLFINKIKNIWKIQEVKSQ